MPAQFPQTPLLSNLRHESFRSEPADAVTQKSVVVYGKKPE